MAWFEFFQKVSTKRPGPSRKKNDQIVLFQGSHGQFFGLYQKTWSGYLEKVSIKQPVLSFLKILEG